MKEFHLFASSRDSADIRKNNDPSDFWIQLPKSYDLSQGYWTCSLKEISLSLDFSPKSSRLYLCCDLLEDSYVRDSLLPILRNVEVGSRYKKYKLIEYARPVYVKTKSTSFQSIRLYLRDDNLNPVTFTSNDLHCVLHFKRKWVR